MKLQLVVRNLKLKVYAAIKVMLTKINQTKIIKYDVKLMFIFYVITDILRRKLFFMAVKAHKSLLTSKIQII